MDDPSDLEKCHRNLEKTWKTPGNSSFKIAGNPAMGLHRPLV